VTDPALTRRARGSKRKGAKGEVDVQKLAIAAGFPDCRRNFGSGARGGNDLIGVEGLAIECKRQESLNIHKAFEQASQAAKPTEIPVVAFKRNHGPWLACVPLEQFFALYAQTLNLGEGA
jgi:hypothetical protein